MIKKIYFFFILVVSTFSMYSQSISIKNLKKTLGIDVSDKIKVSPYVSSSSSTCKVSWSLPEGCDIMTVFLMSGVDPSDPDASGVVNVQMLQNGEKIPVGSKVFALPKSKEGYRITGVKVNGVQMIKEKFLLNAEAYCCIAKEDINMTIDITKLEYTKAVFKKDHKGGVITVVDLERDPIDVPENGKIGITSKAVIIATPDRGAEFKSLTLNGNVLNVEQLKDMPNSYVALVEVPNKFEIDGTFTDPSPSLGKFKVTFNTPDPYDCKFVAYQTPMNELLKSGDYVTQSRYINFLIELEKGVILSSVEINGNKIKPTRVDAGKYKIVRTVEEDTEINFIVEEGELPKGMVVFKGCQKNGLTQVYNIDGGKEKHVEERDFVEATTPIMVVFTPDKNSKVLKATMNGQELLLLPDDTQNSNAEVRIAIFEMPTSEEAKIEVDYSEPNPAVECYAINYIAEHEGGYVTVNDYLSWYVIAPGVKWKEGREICISMHPDELNGYILKSATLNGKPFKLQTDIFGSLYYGFMRIDGEMNFDVVFENATSNQDVINENLFVSTDSNNIIFRADPGKSYSVFSMSGVLVAKGVTHENEIKLSIGSGIYILKVGQQSIKVIVG